MSVLVEALTVVVPRRVLDERYGGGTTAYLEAAADPTVGAHFVCADDFLTAVSFVDYERAFEFTDVLRSSGDHDVAEDDADDVTALEDSNDTADLVEIALGDRTGDDMGDIADWLSTDEMRDVCFVDERMGPSLDCRWLDWRRERDGYLHCWLAGTDPGALAAPDGWTPSESRPRTRPRSVVDMPSLVR